MTIAVNGAVKQVKAAARSVVTMTAGLHQGAKQLRGSMLLLPEALRTATPALDTFLTAVRPGLLLGESRLYVSDEELMAADLEIEKVEALHRRAVLLECKRVYFKCSEWQRDSLSST